MSNIMLSILGLLACAVVVGIIGLLIWWMFRNNIEFADSESQEASQKKQQCPEFPFFGARYPDARCVDGYLLDLDYCDDNGNLYDLGYQVPCPFCNKKEFLECFGVETYNEVVSWVKAHDPEYECEYEVQ